MSGTILSSDKLMLCVENIETFGLLACAQMQLVHLVAVEAFDAALEVAGEANTDVRPRDLQGAFPPIRPDTWPEVHGNPALLRTRVICRSSAICRW